MSGEIKNPIRYKGNKKCMICMNVCFHWRRLVKSLVEIGNHTRTHNNNVKN